MQLHPSSGQRIARRNLSDTVRQASRRGPSAPIVNFLWGTFNFLVGIYLLSRHPIAVDFKPGFLALVLGALAIGIYLSLHFGKVRRDKSGP